MPYVVVAVSSNHNSFGYRGIIAVDPVARKAFESAFMPAAHSGGGRDPLRGESIEADDPRLYWPLTRDLTDPTDAVCREVRKIGVRAARKKNN